MATIPLGNFGQSVARPGPMPDIPQGNPIGDASARLGGIAQGIAADQAQMQRERDGAQAMLTLAKTQNQIHDAHDDVGRGVLDGSIDSAKAASEFQTRVGKITDGNLQPFAPEQRMKMDAHLETLVGSLDRNLAGVVQKRQQQDTAGTIDQFGEQVSREAARTGPGWAVQKYNAMVDFAGPGAGIGPEQQAKLKQSFSERAHATFYESAGTAALTKGDPNALGGLIAQLQGPEGDPLDPQKRTQLTHQLFGWQQSILAKQARDQNVADDAQRVRDNEATGLFNQAQDLFQSGKALDADFIKQLTTAGQGTVREQDIAGLLSAQVAGTGFATKSAGERDALLARMQSASADPAVGTNPAQAKAMEVLASMNDKLKRAADDNPWTAAAGVGRIPDTPQMSPTDPAGAQQIMAQRMKDIVAVEDYVGHKVSPLQPAEVVQIGKMARSLPPDQAATMLGTFGATIKDPERINQVAQQIKDKDGTLALSMLYASAQTTQGRTVSELLLRGEQAIKDKAVTVDGAKETGWTAAIAARINGAYSNTEVQEQTKKAAFLIMAARSADPSQGSVNIDNAVTLATGGIIDRNGQKIPLPYGVKEDDFTKRIESIKPADLAGQAPDGMVMIGRTPMPLAQFVATLPKAALIHAGQGLYNVRAGTGTVTNSSGQRITIKVGP